FVEQPGDVGAGGGSRFGRPLRVAERAVLPTRVDHAPLVTVAVLGTLPRRFGREVDAALPDDVTRRVRPALVVLAVGTHGHTPIPADARRECGPRRARPVLISPRRGRRRGPRPLRLCAGPDSPPRWL